MRVLFIVMILMVSPAIQSAEDDVVIKSGFLTGNQYRSFAASDRRKYAMGLVDGMLLSPFFGAEKKRLSWLESCATGMNDGQIVAIFDKYLTKNPARWHESINALAYFAMKQECER